MYDLSLIEEHYNKYINQLQYWIPEGIYTINLPLLQKYDLLHFRNYEKHEPLITGYFQVVESFEKITLINDNFIIWITPDRLNNKPATYTLISINQSNGPKLEVAFIASGVYNTSKLVLRVLEKFLIEIHENQQMLEKLKAS